MWQGGYNVQWYEGSAIDETGILVVTVTQVSASCSDRTGIPVHVLAIQVTRQSLATNNYHL